MNVELPNNWLALAMEIWPHYRMIDIQINFKGMKDILDAWNAEGGTTNDFVQHLIKLKRNDVLHELKCVFPEIR
jgi:hypothetical protein